MQKIDISYFFYCINLQPRRLVLSGRIYCFFINGIPPLFQYCPDHISYLIPTRIITTGISALIHAQVLFKNAVMINSLYFTQLTITSRPPAAIHPNKNLLITVHTVTVPKSMTLYSRITEKEGDLLLKEMIRNTLTYLPGKWKDS